MTRAELAIIPTEYKFLTKEQVRDYQDFYTNKTRSIIYVDDPELRKSTRRDLQIINEARRGFIDKKITFNELSSTLGRIILGGGDYSQLSKVTATVAFTDTVLSKKTRTIELEEILSEAIETDPEPYFGEIIAGAFYAVFLYKNLNGKIIPEELQRLSYEVFSQSVDSKNKEIKKIGIRTSANVIATLIKDRNLKLEFPEATLESTPARIHGEEGLGDRFPKSTMILAPGRLTSSEKQEEAVVHGMPDYSNKVRIRRIPAPLYGFVFDPRKKYEQYTDKVTQRKKFVYIKLMPLKGSGMRVAFDFKFFRNSDALPYTARFDGLSLWAAVQASRNLRREFSTKLPRIRPDKREISKRKMIDNEVSRLLSEYARFIIPNNSILTVAMRENRSIRYNPKDPFAEYQQEEMLIQLRNSIVALITDFKMGQLYVRPEKKIFNIFKEHIWIRQLDDEDKMDFISSIIKNNPMLLEKEIGLKSKSKLNSLLSKEMKSKKDREEIWSLIGDSWKNLFQIRFETIRDTIEPRKFTFEYKDEEDNT